MTLPCSSFWEIYTNRLPGKLHEPSLSPAPRLFQPLFLLCCFNDKGMGEEWLPQKVMSQVILLT